MNNNASKKNNEKDDLTEELVRIKKRKAKEQLERLRTLVRHQPLNELLGFLSELLWEGNKVNDLFKRGKGKDIRTKKAYDIFVPSLAEFSIIHSNIKVGKSNRPIGEVFKDVDECIRLIINIKDWFPKHLFEDIEIAYKGWEFLLANQQRRFQEFPKNLMGRYFLLYKIIPDEIGGDIKLSESIQTVCGIKLERVWMLLIKTLFGYNGGWSFNNNFHGLNEPPLNITEEELKKFFDFFSLTFEDFKKDADNEDKSLLGQSTQFYGYSPFDSHPILKLNNQFLILSSHYFVSWLMYPLYFKLLDHYQEGEDRAQNAFSDYFGKVFQEYVGKQLSYLGDSSEIISEIEYDNDNKKFVDWILKYDTSAVFFEVKKNVLPQKAKYELDIVKIKSCLNNNIILALKQIYKKIGHLSEHKSGLDNLYDLENIYPVVITFDDTYMLNEKFIRNIIDEELAEENITFEKDWQILTIRDLEEIIPACTEERTFLDILKKKVEDEQLISLEWFDYLEKEELVGKENKLIEETLSSEIKKLNAPLEEGND